MSNEVKTIHEFDATLICEYFSSIPRQGPGSPEATLKALSFVDNLTEKSQIADLGCGTGGQAITLAQNAPGSIAGLDIFPDFIDKFNKNAEKLNLQNRVKGVVGDMTNLPFKNEEFDLIWSEGAIDGMGFEKGLRHWRNFLKMDGYVAVSNLSWFTEERPAELEKYYLTHVPDMGTVWHNVSILQKAGYAPVAAFVLPEACWTDNYFAPQKAVQKAFLEKYAGNTAVEAFIADTRYQAAQYAKCKQYFGYAFYVGRKV
ncbi:MAG: methyltransferase domain-containing protein [Cytophagaceae bacterium]|nr:methyltransferase domain-containing protein [Cytophagaceae bacterium]